MTVSHPAKFSDPILDLMRELIPADVRVLDPFAGIGRIHELADTERRITTVGVEIQKQWADAHPDTIVGDATDMHEFRPAAFDVVATSPTYGNRMADSHDAKDGSKRITYTHVLGEKLEENNTGKLQWGDEYRRIHSLAWLEVRRVLRVDGLLILNISNHIRAGKEARVAEWHVQTLMMMRFRLEEIHTVETKRMRQGENHAARVPYEFVFVFRR